MTKDEIRVIIQELDDIIASMADGDRKLRAIMKKLWGVSSKLETMADNVDHLLEELDSYREDE